MTTVCHLSSAHRGLDVRIFAKECVSAARAGFDTHLVIQASEQDRERAAASGVTLHRLDKPNGRFARFVFSSFKCFLVGLRVRAQIYHFHDPELIPSGVILRLLGKRVV